MGRNVIEGRWTFQAVEEFDDGYYALFRDVERDVRAQTIAGRRHVVEAEMKERRRTAGIRATTPPLAADGPQERRLPPPRGPV